VPHHRGNAAKKRRSWGWEAIDQRDAATPRKEFRAEFCALLRGEERVAEPLAQPVA